jgi:hypothetical protein
MSKIKKYETKQNKRTEQEKNQDIYMNELNLSRKKWVLLII